jgi:N-acetylmuramate 1-kinase
MTPAAARSVAMEAFLKSAGWSDAERQPLAGDASTRRYIRLFRGPTTAVLMDQPQHAETPAAPADADPEARAKLGYNALARLAGADCGRFVAAAKHLRALGLAAPDVYAADYEAGFLLIEDLGHNLYTDALAGGADEATLYAAAIDSLARLHAEVAPATLAPGVPLFRYDETALLAESDLLTEWFLPVACGRAAEASQTEEHRALWHAALHRVAEGAPVFVHRDYHAQNLIWRPGREAFARVGIIDFQDALAGSPAYDLISLLEDARRDVSPELAEAMTARYLAAMPGIDTEGFRASTAILAAQRNAKIIGIFARLARRDDKPRYLQHLPRVWAYMHRDLAHPALAALKAWYDLTIPEEARRVPARLEETS